MHGGVDCKSAQTLFTAIYCQGSRVYPGERQTSRYMASYQELIDYIRTNEGFTAQTCWIAHVKEKHGLTRGPAPNRQRSERAKPCPPGKEAAIERALRRFGMIR